MSLSKVFKESKNFHPEEILPRTVSRDSSRPASSRARHAFKETPPQKGRGESDFRQEQLLSPLEAPPSPSEADAAPGPAADAGTADLLRPDGESAGAEPAMLDQATADQMVDEAYQQGILEGLRRAEADFGSSANSLLEMLQQLNRIRETLLKNSFGEMQDLALSIAEKIIRTSVRDQDTTLLATVEEAIHSAVKSDEFYIHVNPEDFETIQKKSAELIAGVNGLNNIVIKKDPAIERGGCRVESDFCVVDATIGSQFEAIRDKIKNRLLTP